MKIKINNIVDKYLNLVEKVANKLPDPFFLFLILALIVLLASWLLNYLGVTAIHPGNSEIIEVNNLLEKDYLQKIFTSMVDNFINFPPLGLVLASMLGIGIAEKSGFFAAALKQSILKLPDRLLVPMVCFISVNSSMIADAGNVVIPPLAGFLFAASGRNPIAGVCASYASIVGGFSANLAITALDPLLSELTNSAALVIDNSYIVYPTANYYFMIASVFLVTIVCTFITNKVVLKRLDSNYEIKEIDVQNLTKKENKALWISYLAVFVMIIAMILLSSGKNAFFKDSEGNLTILFKSIISLIIIVFGLSGTIYGFISGSVRSGKDVVKMMTDSMNSMGVYILLAFAAGQFLAYFSWSNLGIISAIKGASFIKSMNLEGLPVIVLFLIFSMILNVFIASASAKWTILAPVFVPMFMLLGYSPELAQLVYRVADSTTNMITPLLPYFPLIIVYAKKFDPDISMGKLLSSLLPYSFALIIVWGIFLMLWVYFEFPLGPDAKIIYQ